MSQSSHINIRQSLHSRIISGEWPLGARIPDEINLAEEYGCARATVNRALQALAEDGLVIRKRKGGTRVNPTPIKHAKLEIPVLREQIEMMGAQYQHETRVKKIKRPPAPIRARLRLNASADALYIETLHLADGKPFAFEIRWVNSSAAEGVLDAPLDQISVNE